MTEEEEFNSLMAEEEKKTEELVKVEENMAVLEATRMADYRIDNQTSLEDALGYLEDRIKELNKLLAAAPDEQRGRREDLNAAEKGVDLIKNSFEKYILVNGRMTVGEFLEFLKQEDEDLKKTGG